MNEIAPIHTTAALSPPDPAPHFTEALLAAALNPAMDADKLERLFNVKRQHDADVERRGFNDAMADVEGELSSIIRDADNPQTKSKYAKLEAIQAALQPLLRKNRLSISYNLVSEGDRIRMSAIVARGGYERVYGPAEAKPDTSGARGNVNKTELHGFGSSRSYLQRYLLCSMFNCILIGEDDDGNAGGGRTGNSHVGDGARDRAEAGLATLDQIEQIKELGEATKANFTEFLHYYRVKRIEDFDQKRAQHAIRTLERKRDRMKAEAEGRDPGFVAVLRDAQGEEVDAEPFTDPHRFIEQVIALRKGLPDAAQRLALIEHNADGIADARTAAAKAGMAAVTRMEGLLAELTVGQNVEPGAGAVEQNVGPDKSDPPSDPVKQNVEPGRWSDDPRPEDVAAEAARLARRTPDEVWADERISELHLIDERAVFLRVVADARPIMQRLKTEAPALFDRVDRAFQVKDGALPA